METIINGKRVVFLDKVPAKVGWNILVNHSDILGKPLNTIVFDDVVTLLQIAIESWEFDGSPAEASSYDNLDVVSEILPLATALGTWISEHFATPKN